MLLLAKNSVSPDEKVILMRQDARHEIAADNEQCIPDCCGSEVVSTSSVPKVFLSNDCAYNCAYCCCRRSIEEKTRYRSTPRELAELAYAQVQKGSPGIFITSAVIQTPDYTEELIIETLRILRQDMCYKGYLHAKVMPGADPLLIQKAGRYANRLSVNIEVAKSEGYALLARNKNKASILGPMEDICAQIRAAKDEGRPFATSQTTQMMAGSMGEDDRTILRLSSALYHKYGLSRVYYSAFHYQHKARGYDDLPLRQTPAWRMHRLYQADRLMQLYGFSADEITPAQDAYLEQRYDPKASWALRNPERFPVEINRADRETLLRVPGIGTVGVERILRARRQGSLSFDSLKKMGISLKRSKHFITCGGKFSGSHAGYEVRRALSGGFVGEQLAMAI